MRHCIVCIFRFVNQRAHKVRRKYVKNKSVAQKKKNSHSYFLLNEIYSIYFK